MKFSVPIFIWLLTACGFVARGQLRVVADGGIPSVFGGQSCAVAVRLSNDSPQSVISGLHTRLFQTSSTTAAPVGETAGKEIRAQAGQTIVESAVLQLPAVLAETRFLIQWIEGADRVIDTTEVRVFPTNLLLELQTLAGATPFGLLDPAGCVRDALEAQGIRFEDLGNRSLESFPGRLAIIAPLPVAEQRGIGLTDRIRKLAAKGVAVVWIVPPEDQGEHLMPSFYRVPVSKGNVIVAQAGLVSNLADNPVSQLNLIRLAELALKPEPLDLPEASQKGE